MLNAIVYSLILKLFWVSQMKLLYVYELMVGRYGSDLVCASNIVVKLWITLGIVCSIFET
jgi:hypothetical protein